MESLNEKLRQKKESRRAFAVLIPTRRFVTETEERGVGKESSLNF